MVGIGHDSAVQILTSVEATATLRIEKNAIGSTSQLNTSDDDEEEEVCMPASIIVSVYCRFNMDYLGRCVYRWCKIMGHLKDAIF